MVLALTILLSFFIPDMSLSANANPAPVKAEVDSLIWVSDYQEAQELAKVHKLQILMVFSGSDWCRPCKAFRQNILDQDRFKQWAKSKYLVLYVDFPAKRKNKLSEAQTAHNDTLAKQYNPNGYFPKILAVGKDNTKPCELSYQDENVEQWQVILEEKIASCKL